MQLTAKHLGALDPRIAVPRYDRRELARGVVHIGVGGFHRAHLAAYLDEVARAGEVGWGIVGVGVMERDAAMATALTAQDCLYALAVRDAEGADVRVIGSLVDYVLAAGDVHGLVEAIAAPATRIVSLTVTEGGYPVDEEGRFDPDSPNGSPSSAFAGIVRGLRRRHDTGAGPVTVLSCDNVIGNGAVARTATLGVAERTDPGLVAWITDVVTFPNSMVDRITPATTPADRRWLRDGYGLEDRWPVMTEPFTQWVVEDRFAAGRPQLEDVGVIVTDDVEPYERTKLSLLNGAHLGLGCLASLIEIDTVDAAMADAHLGRFVRAYLDETSPTVPHARGIDLEVYTASLIERFANPAIADQVARLCVDASSKMPTFILSTVRSHLRSGGPIDLAALAVAGWCRYLGGRTDSGAELVPSPDPGGAAARRRAHAANDDPVEFLRNTAVFGEDLADDTRFVEAFSSALSDLGTHGVRSAIDART